MLTEIWYAHLHTPLFLAGTNLSDKLDTHKRPGLRLVYAWDDKKLFVKWNHKIAFLPESNVASMLPVDSEEFLPTFLKVPTTDALASEIKRGPGRPPKAQVSTPTGHVFEGPGKGQS